MKTIFKIVVLKCFLALPGPADAQSQYAPFEASIFIGAGLGTIIDFVSENNYGSKFMPIQAGVKVCRNITTDISLGTGIIYAKRGYRRGINYRPIGGGAGVNVHEIDLYNIDVPFTFYLTDSRINRAECFYQLGIINSIILIEPDVHTTRTIELDRNTFRSYFPQIQTGFGLMIRNNFKASITSNISLISIVRPSFESYFVDQTNYFGLKLVPIELVISLEYILH